MHKNRALGRCRVDGWHLAGSLVVISIFIMGVLLPVHVRAESRSFRWERVDIICSGSLAGTAIPFTGSYRIPGMDEAHRRGCMLRIVWKLNGRVSDSRAESLYRRAVRRNGFLIIDGQRSAFPVSRHRGDRRRFEAVVPLRSLPTLPVQMGIEILEQNGNQVTASPVYRRFAPGNAAQPEAPRLLSVRVNGGARTVNNPRLRLDLTTAGGQVTHYIVTERVLGQRTDFSKSRWLSYPPTTGAARPVTYTLKDTSPGQKTLAIKVKSGNLESAAKVVRFDFVHLVEYTIKGAPSTLAFSRRNGFRHRAVPRQGSRCVLDLETGIADVSGPGECDFVLFDGRRLNSGWRFLSLSIGRDSFLRIAHLRKGVNDQPRTTFRLIREKNPEARRGQKSGFPGLQPAPVPGLRGGLITVKLRGPAGADWRDAFRR